MQIRVAFYVTRANMQILGARLAVKPVIKAHIRIKSGSLTALPVNPEATQACQGGLGLVSFVGQGPTRQPMVPQLGARNVVLGDTKTSLDRPGAMTAIVENTA